MAQLSIARDTDVELLIMDEPTSGLDPLMSAMFQECIAEERRKGRTVLLSSHILAEVEALCDRITIIRKGRAIESGTMSELRHLTRTSIVAEVESVESGGEAISSLAGVHGFEREGKRLSFQVESDRIGAVLAELAKLGVTSLQAQPPTLEELFMRHYQRAEEDKV